MGKNKIMCDCGDIHEEAVARARGSMLPEGSIAALSSIFKVLGDPTRTKIVWALEKNELCVCDLAETLGMTKSAVSHQLSSLKQAKIVKSRRDGKNIFYSLDDQHVTDIIELALAHAEHAGEAED